MMMLLLLSLLATASILVMTNIQGAWFLVLSFSVADTYVCS